MFGGSGGQARFLDYLKGTSGWAKRRRKFMLAQAEHYRPSAGLAPDPNLNYTVEIASLETYERAGHVMTETLRSFVDEWLDSGRTTDGQEEPQKRTLSLSACLAVNGYLQRHPPQFFVFEGNKIGAVFAEEKPPRTGPDNPIAEAKEEATRLFVHFMDSDARRLIAKCHYCKEHFYPKRIQDLYKRGAYCEACRAKASMVNSRREWTKKVLELAAESWPKWKASHGPRQRWVAMQVNGKLSAKDKRITGRWITENDEKILGMVREMAAEKAGIVGKL
jgi:hypothetical protein